MTRIAVIGSGGQLGTDVVRVLTAAGGYDVTPLDHAHIECTDRRGVRQVLGALRPEVVVNCAGYVRVDDCEDHAEEAFRVNAAGALYVARACEDLGAVCAYVSTDYVFDGALGRPYTEEDAPRPINVYGESKLAGEHLVRQASTRWLIVRVAGLYGAAGASGKGGNFVEAILAKAARGEPLRVVTDIRMSPVYARDAACAMEALIRHGALGVVHVANAGHCSWYEFARQVLALTGTRARVEAIPSDAYPAKARRPPNSSLASVRSSEARAAWERSWQDALRAYLAEKGHIMMSVEGG